jgi:hypothetical protein
MFSLPKVVLLSTIFLPCSLALPLSTSNASLSTLKGRTMCCKHVRQIQMDKAYQCRLSNSEDSKTLCQAGYVPTPLDTSYFPVAGILDGLLSHKYSEIYLQTCIESCPHHLLLHTTDRGETLTKGPDGSNCSTSTNQVPVIAGVAIGSFTAGTLTAAIAYLMYRMYRSRNVKQVKPETMPYDNFYRASLTPHHDRQTTSLDPGSSTLPQPVRLDYSVPSFSQTSLSRSPNHAQSTVSGSSGSRTHRPRTHGKRVVAPASAASTNRIQGDDSQRELDELKQQVSVIKEQIKWMKKERRKTQSQVR